MTVDIYTGAPVPAGSDAVIVREKCRRIGDTMLTAHLPKVGENIRKLGEDAASGVQLASSGTLITPYVAALFAASGINEVDVRPRGRVALITTGSELRRPGEALHSGQIYDSNRYMAAGMLSLPWIEVTDLGHLRDDPGAIREALQMASQEHDVILTSAGMSEREGRTEFVPVKVTGRDEMGLPVLARLGRGSSGSLLPMAVADGLAVLRPERIHIPEGTVVQYELFGI